MHRRALCSNNSATYWHPGPVHVNSGSRRLTVGGGPRAAGRRAGRRSGGGQALGGQEGRAGQHGSRFRQGP